MLQLNKLEDLPKSVREKIIEQAEYNAALDYFYESDIPVVDQIAALKAVVKVNPDLDASEICLPIEDFDCYTVQNLLKEIELSKIKYVKDSLWIMNHIMKI